MNIKSATVLQTKTGPDKVFLETDLPCPYVIEAMPNQQPLSMSFDCTAGTGESYVFQNFGIFAKVIDV